MNKNGLKRVKRYSSAERNSVCEICRYDDIKCPKEKDDLTRVCTSEDNDEYIHYFPKITDILSDL